MRKIVLLIVASLFALNTFAQILDKDDDRKVNIGFDLFQDFWMNVPEDVKPTTINLGSSIYAMYNYKLTNPKFSVAFGAGITTHNFSSDSKIENLLADSIVFKPIDEEIDYKKSKAVFTYIDFPLEFRYKSSENLRLALGVKVGLKIDSHIKYKGESFDVEDESIFVKEKGINNLEKYVFGPTFKIGYKWFNFNVYYSVSKLFTSGAGPEISPLSVGITIMPY